MFSFRFKVIERCDADNDLLAAWEISALLRGRVGVDDLPTDRDAAIDWFIQSRIPEEDRADYAAEPQAAEDAMWEAFQFDLNSMAAERIEYFGDHYPLGIDEYGKLYLKDSREITAVGAAYLGLQFHRTFVAGLVELEEPDDLIRRSIKQEFNTWFPKLFEIIASYAVSGDKAGTPHLTAHCRSSRRLHKMLAALCTRVGAGRAKRYDDWTPVQIASNDGGIDCLVHTGGPGMPGNASLILVGATVQSSQIERKIIGDEAKQRFSDYFSERPAAFQGALVRPVDSDILTTEKCRVRDCLFYAYEQVWKNLGSRRADEDGARSFRYLEKQVRSLTRAMNGLTLIDEYENYTLRI